MFAMDDADGDDDDDNGAALATIEFMICLEMWILNKYPHF